MVLAWQNAAGLLACRMTPLQGSRWSVVRQEIPCPLPDETAGQNPALGQTHRPFSKRAETRGDRSPMK